MPAHDHAPAATEVVDPVPGAEAPHLPQQPDLVQLLTPWLIGFSMLGFLGNSQMMELAGQANQEVWYQNAAFFWIPFVLVGAAWAWLALKSVPVKANVRQQFDIFSNPDTWYMTLLYIMTFGTFAITGPSGSPSSACSMIEADCRISAIRMR